MNPIGDEGDWTQEFKERHTSRYRLTDKGRVQAEIAGKWVSVDRDLKNNFLKLPKNNLIDAFLCDYR